MVESINFNDSNWDKVSIPHGLDLLPEEASGDRNYQGIAYYRKHFSIDSKHKGEKIILYFEAIMGKSKIWFNGKLVKEHFGGYLPVIVSIEKDINFDKENVLVVLADNSNDSTYPPGKPQQIMDFTYMGGIYRDCFLITHKKTYLTDANSENEIAGGGVVMWSSDVSREEATVHFKTHLRNETDESQKGVFKIILTDENGTKIASVKKDYSIPTNSTTYINVQIKVNQPQLWSPESPNLYWAYFTLTDRKGKVIDGYKKQIGIRSVEFKGKEGLFLNGEHYPYKLMGVNRHQDFAIIGNAMPNSLHYRDAQKLKEAGVRIVRSAHYPQDPAFMDACDRLGIFVIVATPGWQFWNNDPIFEKRVLSDIRNMIRRDRNHPCVFIWEPILNETHFPEQFAFNALETVKQEWPYTQVYSGIDPSSPGSKYFPLIYSAPNSTANGFYHLSTDSMEKMGKVYFTREWGDNVDDWSSNNSDSRVHRSWGEVPMLVQAQHYYDWFEPFLKAKDHHLGGTLWCGIDHFRGYHPQNFYGGLLDPYRQEKYAYRMFMSQRSIQTNPSIDASTGPMVFIAHELSPFSSPDVVVYSNCDEVRLTVFEGGKTYTYQRPKNVINGLCPIITFKNVYNFMQLKALARGNQRSKIYLLAEGLIDGKVVTTYKVRSALKPTRLRLRIDNEHPVIADGSDIAVVIAELVDDEGNIKRLNNDYVRFTIEGEGRLLNPEKDRLQKLDWGTAPILVQTTTVAGKIKIRVELEVTGISTAQPCEFEFSSMPSYQRFIAKESEIATANDQQNYSKNQKKISDKMKSELKKKLNEVYQQQTDFGDQSVTNQ